MKISLITPAKKYSRNGNRATALRWARILRGLGHRVHILVEYEGQKTDLMIALHAWRSAKSIVLYRSIYPKGRLLLALTGTDINSYIHSHPSITLNSIEAADYLICLHSLVNTIISKEFHEKLRVIHQSAPPLKGYRKPTKLNFDICLIANLRNVKDPLRGAYALRELPASSRLRLIHFGKAETKFWEKKANTEMRNNPRYIWKGQKKGWEVRKEFTKTQLMLISSLNEGGANVVSEALVAGVPIIASRISGNIGLLGEKYPGYFTAGNAVSLRRILLKCEQEPIFMAKLREHCKVRAKQFIISEETLRWESLLKETVR